MTRNIATVLLAGSLVLSTFQAHAGTVASAAKKGAAVAFIRWDSAAAIKTFGGKGTTDASISPISAGVYQITFDGKFPDDVTNDNLVIQVTADNASVDNIYADYMTSTASPTQLVIYATVFRDNVGTAVNSGGSATIFIGN